jgi:acetyl-CoA carboxylase carboxyl transferase subunit alpha
MHAYLDFERPIAELEGKIAELRQLASADATMQLDSELARLEQRMEQLVKDTYAKLTPWQKVQVARHPARPHFTDYVKHLFDEFTPLAGDRAFGEDTAIVTAMARFRGHAVAVVGQEKGNDTKSRLKHNFGMAMPEGYRKVQRVFELADRFGLPIISLVDTSGAYSGVSAEDRGQAEAIARTTEACLNVRVPLVVTIIGEGGSGGAVAIATGNKVFMLENSVYSVISEKAQDAAAALRITAQDLAGLGIIDGIIPEPLGGAHRAPEEAIGAVGEQISRTLGELSHLSPDEVRRQRREKYLAIGRDLGK